MERRKMIKNLVLGSRLILYPGVFLRNAKEPQVQIIIIGTPCPSFVEEFLISNSDISCINIGNTEGIRSIDYDFSFINMQFAKCNHLTIA